jgi:hypothetical protein
VRGSLSKLVPWRIAFVLRTYTRPRNTRPTAERTSPG